MNGDPGESAVSAVVGAVLLLALFSTAMSIYTISTLPEWKADKEEIQQKRVQAVLGDLRSDVEALSVRGDAGPVTAAVPLEAARVPLLQQTPARGTLGLADGFGAAFSFPATPSLFLSDGAAVAAPTTSLATPPCAGKCVATLEDLVLGLATSGVTSGKSVSVTITITDSAATPATLVAVLSHVGTASSSDLTLTVGSTTHYVQANAGTALATASAPYRVNLLDSRYTFASALSRLSEPLQVTFATSLSGSPAPSLVASGYTAVFTDANGLLRATGTGVATATPIPAFAGQRLVYRPAYQAYPSQDLSFEGGGVLVDAGATTQAMVADPSLRVAVGAGVGTLEWTLIDLDGAAGGVSGSDGATVRVTHTATQDVVLLTPASCNPCASITLDTPSAAGWANLLDLRTGLANAGASATVATATGQTTLTLASGSGPVTAGWVIHLRIIHATVTVT